MKRTAATLLLLLAGVAGAADYATATKHDDLLTPSREALRPKVQWAPTGNFSALHGRAVFEEEGGEATRPYAGERREVAAGSRIFLSRDSYAGQLDDAPSLHRYAYAHGNPLRYWDRNGRQVMTCPGADPARIIACSGEDAQVVAQRMAAQDAWKRMAAEKLKQQAAKEASRTAAEEAATKSLPWWKRLAVAVGIGSAAVPLASGPGPQMQVDTTPDPRVVQSYREGCAGGGAYSCRRLDELGVPRVGIDPAPKEERAVEEPTSADPVLAPAPDTKKGEWVDPVQRDEVLAPGAGQSDEVAEFGRRVYGGQPISRENPDYGSGRGRRGSVETRKEIDRIRDEFLKNNPGWQHVGGGTSAQTGEKRPEEYLPGPNGTKGSSYVDLTFRGPNRDYVRINTVDADEKGVMTHREETNRDRISDQDPTAPVITIPKGTK